MYTGQQSYYYEALLHLSPIAELNCTWGVVLAWLASRTACGCCGGYGYRSLPVLMNKLPLLEIDELPPHHLEMILAHLGLK